MNSNTSESLDKLVKYTTINQSTEDRETDNSNNPIEPSNSANQIDRRSINRPNMYRKWKGGDIWGCSKCSSSGDRFDLLDHHCKNNKKTF